MTGTPARARGRDAPAASSGTPGLSTMRSAPAKRRRAMPAELELDAGGAQLVGLVGDRRRSVASASTVRAAADEQLRRRDAAARGADDDDPLATTRRSVVASSSQLQRGEAEQGEDDREDEEPRDDLRLAPADQLEVVVERRHPEDALARELERRRPG